MKESVLFLLFICTLHLVNGCGSGGASTPPPLPATHFGVMAVASAATAGTSFKVTVSALDSSGAVVSSYTGTVHFSSSDAQAVLPKDSALSNGTGTFSVTLRTAGTQSVTATDSAKSSVTGSSNSISVVVPASHFSFAVPSNATTGIAFNITVTALDATNNAVTSYSGTVHFSSSDGQAVLPANSTLTNGTGTFSATLKTAGGQTITAADTVTASIAGTSSLITVGAQSQATHFTVTAPAGVIIGHAFNLTVTAQDALNNTAAGYSGTVHFSSTDPQAVLPANSTLTNGLGNFSAALKFCCGDQFITATDTVTASITGTSNPINASGGPITHFSVTAPATATVGTPINVGVTALDASNNVVTLYNGNVLLTSSDSQAVLPTGLTLTFGVGNFPATLKTLGSQTITVTDSIRHSITGTSNSIMVGSNAATHFSASAPVSVSAQNPFNLTVKALDAANNPAISYSGMVHFTSSDGQALLPPNSALANGAGSFSATLKTIGSQTITATDTVTASITGTSNSIGVFTRCGAQGAQCGAAVLPPCCPGFVCVPASTRAFCDPGAATPLATTGLTPLAIKHSSRFTAACSMGTARESHTATLLGNGLVLITGGGEKLVSLATAELFNPDTHSFAPTGDMINARAGHTATLLTNGNVLVSGGHNGSGSTLTAVEMFDPARGNFVPAGSMSVGRESHTATLLGDGRVLITGGDDGGITLASAELFDPASWVFVRLGSMGAARAFHTATLLKNGKVLVIGGRDADGRVLGSAELFDPASGNFKPVGKMNTPRQSHTATLLPDGKVLIAGGDNGAESFATAEIFDPGSETFALTGRMQTAREFHTATLRKDGTVLVAGGAESSPELGRGSRAVRLFESTATSELFDPKSDNFKPTSDMANARARHAAILLSDGEVLLTGGINPDTSALADSLTSAESFQ